MDPTRVLVLFDRKWVTQSAGAVEYADSTCAEG